MSTPTITATLITRRDQGYDYEQAYRRDKLLHDTAYTVSARSSTYGNYQNLSAAPVRTSSSNTTRRIAGTPTAKARASPSSEAHLTMTKGRPVDWGAFYKNGPPKEIIVIDDDTPPPQSSPRKATRRPPQYYSKNEAEVLEPAAKKRRTVAGSSYETAPSRHHGSYSDTNSPHGAGSGSPSISTDRTTSMHTTAPTSMGSHGSIGRVYQDNTIVGTKKRKRVTRQSASDEKRRREQEVLGDAYSLYIPPPNPPIKARDVHVQLIRDVSLLTIHATSAWLT